MLEVHSFQVSRGDLTKFLRLVAEGEQDKAEAMLKKNPALALTPTDVTDLSKRSFKNITALQYALWALDWHMWTMLLRYIPPGVVTEQIAQSACGLWVPEHGVTANWENLIQVLNQYVSEVRSKKPYEVYSQTWIKQVGGAQLLLPAHVINEYSHPTRPFHPTPDFSKLESSGAWRTRQISLGDSFFSASFRGGTLGEGFAVVWRGDMSAAYADDMRHGGGGVFSPCAERDSTAVAALFKTRASQRAALVAQYLSKPEIARRVALKPTPLAVQLPLAVNANPTPARLQVVTSTASPLPPALEVNSADQKSALESAMLSQFQAFIKPAVSASQSSSLQVSASDLRTFLRLVAEGEQDKAEEMLKSNPALALVSEDVTDLSKRTFTNITGFQYAVWALDWHMWTMLLKYIPQKEAADQIAQSEQGLWVAQHGVTANWENLIQALNQYVSEVCSDKPYEVSSQTWIKQVGGAQLLLPAHVINEYCHSTRPFYPMPDFTKPESTGAWRTRTTDEGEWFSAKYGEGNLGEEFAAWRGSNDHVLWRVRVYRDTAFCFSMPGLYLGAERDSVAVAALLKTRQAQRAAVVARYCPKEKLAKPSELKGLQEFLRLVAEGEQDKAEAMLKSNPTLALVPGDVTDLSKRSFTNITAFQYAVWALDWHMWIMIRRYLSDEDASLQAQGFETGLWVKIHGIHANLNNLIQAYQNTFYLYNAKKYSECNTAWVQQVGGAQLLLPAHVINEYCHPMRSFYPLPNFKDGLVLPRTRSLGEGEGEWFTAMYDGSKLGEKFAVHRATHRRARVWHRAVVSCVGGGGLATGEWLGDQDAVRALSNTRITQREELITELRRGNVPQKLFLALKPQPSVNASPVLASTTQVASLVVAPALKAEPSDQKSVLEPAMLSQFQKFTKLSHQVSVSDLTEFLRFVAEGDQDKAEAMLKNNSALALVSGDVTDLSKRTFANVTGFQYAVWALDWHMWTMIRKYLPDAEAKQQAEGFETGTWVRQHGVHAQQLLDNLVKALQATIDLYNAKNYAASYTALVQQVGGVQLLLPAHVVNEYCHPTRSFNTIPNFRDAVILPRTRTVHGARGEWFTATYIHIGGGKLGEKFAIVRGECHNCYAADLLQATLIRAGRNPVLGSGILLCDRDSVRALCSTRTAQREELIIELKVMKKLAKMCEK